MLKDRGREKEWGLTHSPIITLLRGKDRGGVRRTCAFSLYHGIYREKIGEGKEEGRESKEEREQAREETNKGRTKRKPTRARHAR